MKLSIITPVYNSVNYIVSCLENVIQQNCIHIEHVLIDGGSKDGTVEVIKEYAKKHSHIQWISEKDSGQSDAMNKGIELAKGNFISFLNVDDYYQPEILNYFIQLIDNRKEVFFVGNCNVWNSENDLIYISKPKNNTFFSTYFKQTYPINPASYFYKKSLHQELGFYDLENHYCMDLDFILKYINKYKSFYYEDNVWGNFRLVESSKTLKDQMEGKMIERRDELFSYYWKKNNPLIRLFYIGINKLFMHY
jgi:glycosyltransferase involved in cell wall biosynthesis